MKTKIYLTLLGTLSFLCLRAQIPNNSFENWSGVNITSWVNTNGLMAFAGNAQSVFKSSDAHSGSFACEMVGTKVNTKPGGVFIPDYVGSIFVGKQILFDSYRGFPYTLKPAKLEFWSKYYTKGTDTASAVVALTRWNVASMNRDTVAIGAFLTSTNDTSAYQLKSVNLTYLSDLAPDTAILLFSAVSVNATQGGARFLIDDLEFKGGNVGLAQANEGLHFSLFPNPSSGKLHLQFYQPETKVTCFLYSLLGELVQENTFLNTAEVQLQTPGLKPGIYLLQVMTPNGIKIQKIEIE